jgi:hypothetical protein
MGCIYVIRTFVRTGKTIRALPPTICFERDLALEMAQADEPEAEGVAVYELDSGACGETEAKPFAAFGFVPGSYWRIERDTLLAAAPVKGPASTR